MDPELYKKAASNLYFTDPNEQSGAELFKLRSMMCATIIAGALAGNRFCEAEAAMITVDAILAEAVK